jgi:hypothetical protein
LRWNLPLLPDGPSKLVTPAACHALPAGTSGDRWELVLLVGYAGRLLLHGDAVAAQASAAATPSGEYQGIQVVRQPLRLVKSPAEPSK